MLNDQIKARGIKNLKVLQALQEIPRHKFVPTQLVYNAYDDNPLPIGYGQTISQPYIVALMTELIEVDEKSKILEIGTGSGYQSAVLAQIAGEVYSVEIVKELQERAKVTIEKLGIKNIEFKIGDGHEGWKEKAPYDAIIVTCAAQELPSSLIEQLKVGGRLCIPVGEKFATQQLLLIKKINNEKIESKLIAHVRFVPLVRKK